jgi:hypothetical protein
MLNPSVKPKAPSFFRVLLPRRINQLRSIGGDEG